MKAKVWPALIALYVIWGSTYLAIRFAIETIPPFLSAGMRFFVSGAVLLAWRRAAGDPMPSARQWRSEALIGVLLLLGGNGLVSYAEKRIASGIAALIVGTVPLWLVLLEAIRPHGTKPGRRALAGLVVGFAGVLFLVGPRELAGGSVPFDPVGIGAVMVAAFFWSIGSIYSRSAAHPSAPLVGPGAQMLAGSAALFFVSAATGELGDFRLEAVSGRSWTGLAYLIAFGSLVGYVSYVWLLRNAPVSLVATYAYVNPLVAILLGAALASEAITPRIALAAAIIIGSVVLTNSRARTKTTD